MNRAEEYAYGIQDGTIGRTRPNGLATFSLETGLSPGPRAPAARLSCRRLWRTRHLTEDPESVNKGLDIATESLLIFVTACVKAGVDGSYASTQGGEAKRFADPRGISATTSNRPTSR